MPASSQGSDMSERAAIMIKLPPEVLVKLLSKLDQQQLGVASLVCTSWRDAAFVALKQLVLTVKDHKQASLLPYWLAGRAQHLQHLELCYSLNAPIEVHLPLSNAAQLCSLSVRGGKLTGDASNALALVKHSLTALYFDQVSADLQLLSNIAALTNLHSLTLYAIPWGPMISTASRNRYGKAANSVWSTLLQLTSLSLAGCDLDNSAVKQITCLSNLQRLDLSANQLRDAEVLLPLSSSLTYLCLDDNHREFDCIDLLEQDPPQQLQHLSMDKLSMYDAGEFEALTNLTHLSARELQSSNNEELLGVLPSLQKLQYLDLRGAYGDVGDGVNIECFNAALQLPELTFLDFGYNKLLAPDPWGNPPTQIPPTPVLLSNIKVPQLQVLLLDCLESPMDPHANILCRKQDLKMLVDKCPKLQWLDMSGRINADCSAKDLQPLQQLTCLTQLLIGGGDEDGYFCVDDDILKIIATLTTLKNLLVHGSSKVTNLGLMYLTKLTRLTQLYVMALNEADVSEHLVPPGQGCCNITATNKDPKQPNVWQQLQKRCAKSPVCVQERQKEIERELKAAKKAIVIERKRTAAAKKEAVAAQQELAALRQQLAELRAANSSQDTS